MRGVRLLVVVLVFGAACGGASGDADRFCQLNSDLESFYSGPSFLPLEVREEAGRPKLLEALNSKVVIFEFDEVAAFGEIFDEFFDAAPDGIRSSVAELDAAIGPLIDAADEPTIELVQTAFGEGAASAGFEVEYWVTSNCPGG
jgi:hypothetical protein